MDETLSPALCATDKNGLLLEVMKHEADQFSEVVGSSKVTFFFNETYERVLKKAGFTKVTLFVAQSTITPCVLLSLGGIPKPGDLGGGTGALRRGILSLLSQSA